MVTRITLLLLAFAAAVHTSGQIRPAENTADFELGTGLNFMFNDSTYQFRMSGMVQPYFGAEWVQGESPDYFLNPKRAYLNFYGKAAKEKISFFFQLDFSDLNSLLDAWVAFHPADGLNITLGQKQTIANNREMMMMEDRLVFADRSLLSTAYSRTGREFGLYVDYALEIDNVVLVPQAAVTSGDGRNSFGQNSRDVDFGGVKYAGRLDVYPMGMFAPGNNGQVADLAHEEQPKAVIGGAASYNVGATDAVGEGHGNFFLFDRDGNRSLADYRQLYADVLIKYRGFSFLGEYVVATAAGLDEVFPTEDGINPLFPTEIARYLALGTGFNMQAGYVTRSGYGLDGRVFAISPEFNRNPESLIGQQTGWSLGFSKYFKGQAAKVSLAYTALDRPEGGTTGLGELLFQVIF